MNLASETLFLRDARADLPRVLAARERTLSDLGEEGGAPAPVFVQQAPAATGAALELAASAVLPHHRGRWAVSQVRVATACACGGCARSAARVMRLGEQVSLYTSNLYGRGGDAFEQASNIFAAAERLLEQCGMGFHDVVRTWIYLRDIDRDYDALNRARRQFFRQRGIERRPASTGVEGSPWPDAHALSMSLLAVKSARSLDVARMSAPSLGEAWSYGGDFSRGLRLTEVNKVALHVSGTASIDQAGRTVHAGDVRAQIGRMLDNIASLLARQGAGFENLVSAVVYLRDASAAPILRSICEARDFQGFPCAVVEARLCRPDLLCEGEALAMLPLAAARV